MIGFIENKMFFFQEQDELVVILGTKQLKYYFKFMGITDIDLHQENT